jgi:hypothetical protein
MIKDGKKYCPKCKQDRPVEEFGICHSKSDGLQSFCKECRKIYYQENRDRIIAKINQYQKTEVGREIHNRASRKYQKTEKGKKSNEKYYYSERGKKYRNTKEFKEIKKRNDKNYYENNKVKILEQNKQYRQTEKGKEVQRKAQRKRIKSGAKSEYERHRKQNDFNYKLLYSLYGRINDTILRKDKIKSDHTFNLLGCTIDYFKEYLESQFTEGMSWENYGKGGWHLDHIIPCSYFDFSDPYCQKVCFHFLNLQPLWEKENLKKSNKLPENYKDLLVEIMECIELKNVG